MRVVVVIPTYNERENLEIVLRGILRLGIPDLSILVVDDASPDGTGAIADRIAAQYPEAISVLHRTEKRGLGSAYQDGFRRAIADGAEAVCEMDADGSHDPAALPALIAPLAMGSDITIGSRRISGGEVRGWGPHRHVMSSCAAMFSRIALGLRTHDVTSGFRCYRRSVLEALLAQQIASEGYAFQEEMVFHSERLGFRVTEVPILFKDRAFGVSKLTLGEVPGFFATIFRLLQKHGRIPRRRATQ